MRPFSFDAVPLMVSPPLLFQFRQTADLTGGTYDFLPVRSALTPDRPLKAGAVYWFRTITASADVAESDYAGAIATMPTFSLFTQAAAQGPYFRQAIQLGKYLSNLPFEYADDFQQDNAFRGYISGQLTQTPSLLGKTSITITVIFAAQEIGDKGFIESLRKGYKE